jgi:hypothetical protein
MMYALTAPQSRIETMTSIYRPNHPATNREADNDGARTADSRAQPSQQPRNWDESEWAGRRKAQPAQAILPATRHWMNSISPEYRPHSLAIRFPRIANLIAASWDNPKECSAYIHSLLHDQRGGRKGFPPQVQKDLADLRIYFAMLHPIICWDEFDRPKIRS